MFSRKTVVLGLTGLLLAGCGGSSSDSDDQARTHTSGTLNLPEAIAQVNYSFQAKAAALSGNVTYRASQLPEWASIDTATGIIAGKPDADDVSARVPVVIEATNGQQTITLKGNLQVEHSAAYIDRAARDFYATDFNGKARSLRNDLSGGELKGEVQFVQTHSVAPANNFERNQADETQSKYMPRLTALRDTLLLFIPDQTVKPTTIDVQVSLHGEPLMTLPMAHPNALPTSDTNNSPAIQYSNRAWSVRLPWDTVKNGLSLRFVTDHDASSSSSGYLPAANIDVGEASQIVFQSIRLGMLTEPGQENGHFTLRDPIMAATDYFQTMPVSRLVMGSYADTVLDRVILRSGVIYDKTADGASQDDGGVYSGDMRGDVAKSQVSVGINMANFGYPSHHMNQAYPHVFKQITNHHAWGMYQNGRVYHGLSGGNGIGTLYSSWGNEASHEWGHAYGLGHYPGQGLTEDGRWAVHHADSGWGYIAHRNRMRANITGIQENGDFAFHKDSMSGGWESSPFSVYTHYTGYSARIIQNDVARLPVPDTSFPSGYKKWNTTTGQYENYSSPHPAPASVGVPVATILGGYDPDGTAAVIYPVFHGNYGNVFELPKPDLSADGDLCWVEVSNAEGNKKQVSVASDRHNASSVNQLHFNLHADFRPTSASLFCRRDGDIQTLTQTSFDGSIPELPPVGIVGQDTGYQQLRAREIAEVETLLAALDNTQFAVMSGELATLVASYTDTELQNELSTEAWQRLEQLKEQDEATREIAVILEQARRANLTVSETRSRLLHALIENGLIDSADDLVPSGDVIRGNNLFFDSNLDEDGYVALTPLPQDLASTPRWTMDLKGRIHPTATPWECLTPVNGRLGLTLCQADNANQRWQYNEENQQLRNEGSGRCLDYAHHNTTLITYGCTGSWNQTWSGVSVSHNRLLSLLDGALLAEVYETLLTD
ncbi:MAG: M66 family metalloprotease [Pseudomonadota bacterium]|nr:M66 family metalloprotease [Pseudomonadota bacterium]